MTITIGHPYSSYSVMPLLLPFRYIIGPRQGPDTIYLLDFLHIQVTVTVTLLLIFSQKVRLYASVFSINCFDAPVHSFFWLPSHELGFSHNYLYNHALVYESVSRKRDRRQHLMYINSPIFTRLTYILYTQVYVYMCVYTLCGSINEIVNWTMSLTNLHSDGSRKNSCCE